MNIKSKVICINDDFPPWARATYTSLPVKGTIYTIRHIDKGLDAVELVKNGTDDNFTGSDPRKFKGTTTIMILLEEIKNPPHLDSKKEPGFKLEKFAEIPEQPKEKVKESIKNPGPPKTVKPKKPKKKELQTV
jgi:hypothetical protein